MDRKRAFVPESLGPLEGRQLLSGAGSQTPHGPVGLSGVGFNTAGLRIKGDFQQYALGRNFQLLRTQLATFSAAIPYGKVDGLGQKTNAILDQMRANQANGVPGAIASAYQQVRAGLKADVDARIADGSVHIFDKNG